MQKTKNYFLMKERIQEFIDSKGISAGELASLLEVQRSNISHILNGRNKPGASLIEKMLLVFPELNARWLLTGEGNMLENELHNISSVSQIIPLEEKEKKVEPKEKEPEMKQKRQENKEIDKVVLLYNDGTFISYKK